MTHIFLSCHFFPPRKKIFSQLGFALPSICSVWYLYLNFPLEKPSSGQRKYDVGTQCLLRIQASPGQHSLLMTEATAWPSKETKTECHRGEWLQCRGHPTASTAVQRKWRPGSTSVLSSEDKIQLNFKQYWEYNSKCYFVCLKPVCCYLLLCRVQETWKYMQWQRTAAPVHSQGFHRCPGKTRLCFHIMSTTT